MKNEKKQGGTGTLIKIAYRNIWRNKRRTAFCFSAVGIAVFFIVIYSSLIDGMTQSINDLVQVFEFGHVKVVSADFEAEQELLPVWHPVSGGQSWRELAASIQQEIPEIRAVFPRISTYATLQESTIKHALLWGLDIEREMDVSRGGNHFNLTRRNNGLVQGEVPDRGEFRMEVDYSAFYGSTDFISGGGAFLKEGLISVSKEYPDFCIVNIEER